jgi:2-polyprenyl-3-methyl-5-hydroxy-6-metoxy-1,4-benzoquinol methylase
MTMEFSVRTACIACGSSHFVSLWSTSYSDPFVRTNLEDDQYALDASLELRDRPIERVRCMQCGLAFHRYIMTEESIQDFYSNWIDANQIERYEAGLGPSESTTKFETARQYVKHVLRIASISGPDCRILDFGCGDGAFLTVCRVFGFESYGIDISTTRDQRADHAGVKVLPSLSALDSIGVGALDVVSMFQVLEHLAEPDLVLQQLVSRLRIGGLVIIEVPDCSGITVPTNRHEFHAVHPLEHINHFTPESLSGLARSHGLESVRRPPAHVTTSPRDLGRTELSRFVNRSATHLYFHKART